MKNKILLFFLCVCLSTAYIFSDDELPDDGQSIPVDELDISAPATVVVDITQLIKPSEEVEPTSQDFEIEPVISLEPELISVTQSVQRVSASDTTGLKSVLLSILGDYESVVTDYEYRNNNNTYYSHSISIERDWAWLCSCGIFAILLYCTFRTIGGIAARF